MIKNIIKRGKGYNKSLPSNILEFLQDRPEQLTAAKKANKWLLAITGRSFCGGTAIGKHYSSLVLDISYQDGNVHIGESGDISFWNVPTLDKKTFEKELLSHYEIQE